MTIGSDLFPPIAGTRSEVRKVLGGGLAGLRHADVSWKQRGHGRGSGHGGSHTCRITADEPCPLRNLAIAIMRLTGHASIAAPPFAITCAGMAGSRKRSCNIKERFAGALGTRCE